MPFDAVMNHTILNRIMVTKQNIGCTRDHVRVANPAIKATQDNSSRLTHRAVAHCMQLQHNELPANIKASEKGKTHRPEKNPAYAVCT